MTTNRPNRAAAIACKAALAAVILELAKAHTAGLGGTYRATDVLCNEAGLYRRTDETLLMFGERLRHEADLEGIALANNPDTETS